MKKAKITLGAIALFAIVGGVLAFKARTFGNTLICGQDSRTPTICDVREFATIEYGYFSAYFTGNFTQVEYCDYNTICNGTGDVWVEGYY